MSAISLPKLSTLTGLANVLDYGADPSGTNDSTTAITSAAASSSGIYFPPGTYILDTLSIPRSGFAVAGAGQNLTKIKKKLNGTTTALFKGTSVSFVTISGLSIDGQGPSQSAWQPNAYNNTTNADAIQFTTGTNVLVKDCYIANSLRAGVQFYGVSQSNIENVWGYSNAWGTVSLYHDTNFAMCNDSKVIGGGGDSDYCDALRVVSDNVSVIGFSGLNARVGTIYGAPDNYAGIYTENCNNVTIANCLCRGNSNRGIDNNGSNYLTVTGNVVYSHANGGILTGNSSNVISGNTVTGSTLGGIQVRGNTHIIIGNICIPGGQSQQYGIYRQGTTTYCQVSNNILRGNSTAAIDPSLTGDTGFQSFNNMS